MDGSVAGVSFQSFQQAHLPVIAAVHNFNPHSGANGPCHTWNVVLAEDLLQPTYTTGIQNTINPTATMPFSSPGLGCLPTAGHVSIADITSSTPGNTHIARSNGTLTGNLLHKTNNLVPTSSLQHPSRRLTHETSATVAVRKPTSSSTLHHGNNMLSAVDLSQKKPSDRLSHSPAYPAKRTNVIGTTFLDIDCSPVVSSSFKNRVSPVPKGRHCSSVTFSTQQSVPLATIQSPSYDSNRYSNWNSPSSSTNPPIVCAAKPGASGKKVQSVMAGKDCKVTDITAAASAKLSSTLPSEINTSILKHPSQALSAPSPSQPHIPVDSLSKARTYNDFLKASLVNLPIPLKAKEICSALFTLIDYVRVQTADLSKWSADAHMIFLLKVRHNLCGMYRSLSSLISGKQSDLFYLREYLNLMQRCVMDVDMVFHRCSMHLPSEFTKLCLQKYCSVPPDHFYTFSVVQRNNNDRQASNSADLLSKPPHHDSPITDNCAITKKRVLLEKNSNVVNVEDSSQPEDKVAFKDLITDLLLKSVDEKFSSSSSPNDSAVSSQGLEKQKSAPAAVSQARTKRSEITKHARTKHTEIQKQARPSWLASKMDSYQKRKKSLSKLVERISASKKMANIVDQQQSQLNVEDVSNSRSQYDINGNISCEPEHFVSNASPVVLPSVNSSSTEETPPSEPILSSVRRIGIGNEECEKEQPMYEMHPDSGCMPKDPEPFMDENSQDSSIVIVTPVELDINGKELPSPSDVFMEQSVSPNLQSAVPSFRSTTLPNDNIPPLVTPDFSKVSKKRERFSWQPKGKERNCLPTQALSCGMKPSSKESKQHRSSVPNTAHKSHISQPSLKKVKDVVKPRSTNMRLRAKLAREELRREFQERRRLEHKFRQERERARRVVERQLNKAFVEISDDDDDQEEDRTAPANISISDILESNLVHCDSSTVRHMPACKVVITNSSSVEALISKLLIDELSTVDHPAGRFTTCFIPEGENDL